MSQPMKVLHVSAGFYPAFSMGGPIPAFLQLCQSLAALGCDVKVVTTNASGTGSAMDVDCSQEVMLAERLHVRYCKYLTARSVSPALLGLLPGYVRWADVVHLSSVYNFPTIPTLLLCKILGKPLIWSPHGALQRWEGSRRTELKAIWERICALVAPRPLHLHVTSVEEATASAARFPGSDIHTIPYTVPVPDRSYHVENEPALRLLYLGRLDRKKGLENLLAACRTLYERGDRLWSLTIAGGGPLEYAETLRNHVRALEQSTTGNPPNGTTPPSSVRVRMVGEVTGQAKEALFAEADVLVVPSYTENFGLVVPEALLRGVPVIASTGTPWRRLEEEGCGLWVKNDPESLADAIERIGQMPMREMGRRGSEWARKEFHPEAIAGIMYASYRRIAESQRRAPNCLNACS